MQMDDKFFCKAVTVLLTVSIILCHDLKNPSHVFSALAILAFLIWLFQKNFEPLTEIPSYVWTPVAIFALSLIPGVIFANHIGLAIHTFANYIIFWPLHGLMAYCVSRENIDNVKIFLVTVIFVCVEGSYVFYEFLTGQNLRSGGFIGGYSNLFCIMMIVHSVIFFVVLVENCFTRRQKLLASIFEVILLLAILGIGSRGGYLTCLLFALGSFFFYIKKYRSKMITVACIILLLAGLFTINPYLHERWISIMNTTTNISNTSRLNAWEHVWIIVKDKPFYGMGLGNWKLDYDITLGKTVRPGNLVLPHTHNNISQMAAEGGYSAVTGYLFMMVFFALLGIKKYYRNGNPYGMMIFNIIFVLNLYGMVEWTFGWHYTAKTFFFVLGCLMALAVDYDDSLSKH